MICSRRSTSLIGRRPAQPKGGGHLVLGFFVRIVSVAMGCLFACFRFNDSSSSSSSSSQLICPPLPSTPAPSDVAVTKRNRLSSLLLSHKEEHGELAEDKENTDLEASPQVEYDVKELKDEAKFLKACGTLPETPIEIRQISQEWKVQLSGKDESEHLKFRSWLTGTPIERLNHEKEPHQNPPGQKCEEPVKGTKSIEQTPSSCMTGEQNTGRISPFSIEVNGAESVRTPSKIMTNESHNSATSSAPSVQCRYKSVRFDCDSSTSTLQSSSSGIASENSKKFEAAGNCHVLKPEPYPTPLKLSDEMQTPGTVFPAYQDNVAIGKKTRIRSQYAYPVLKPVENLEQWKDLKDEAPGSSHSSGKLVESPDEVLSRHSITGEGIIETSGGEELNVEASLASWLKPTVTNIEANNHFNSKESVHRGRFPGDRPILGLVAAHWRDDEQSRISPKWWDGNGIPNSTTKYKEDQKVSWHATPFEERLEKALSEETLLSQRKRMSAGTPPIGFDEAEESDTALSMYQSPSNVKSIVSC